MKQAILLHGTGGSDRDYFWFGDTKKYFEEHGFQVWWPLLPNTDKPKIQETLKFVQENAPKIDESTIVIGHSSAAPLILSFLQRINVRIKQAILVAGFYVKISEDANLMLEDNYDWNKIKSNTAEIILINFFRRRL